MKKIKKVKDLDYKVDYEIILKGIEPFTNISTKIVNFLDDLVNNHNLISSYSWKILDTVEKSKTIKQIKKFFSYLKKQINEYRDTHQYRDD